MKLKKWQWALVGIIPVGIISLAVAVYLLKTPTQFPGTPNFWDLAFDFLDKWASAGAPAMTLFAVLVALWIGISGIRETRNIQRKERNERLLNEVRDWALEVAESAVKRQTRITSELWETKLKYKFVRAKSKYASEAANLSFSDLSPSIRDVTEKLDQAIEAITSIIEKRVDGQVLVKSEEELTESVEKLITEIARTKKIL